MKTAHLAVRRSRILPALWAAMGVFFFASPAFSGLNPAYVPIANPFPNNPTGFGYTACGVGDVNADGYADFAVTTYQGTFGYGLEIFHGNPAAPLGAFGRNNYPTQVRACAAGDVNGDGFDDVLITYGGTVEVLSGVDLATTYVLTGTGSFGTIAQAAGDVNGDGYDDVIVGAPADNKAYIYRGSSTGPHSNDLLTLTGAAGTKFGAAVAGLGDVNGDGHDDVAVGAPDASTGAAGGGEVQLFIWLYLGNTNPYYQTYWLAYTGAVDFGATLAPAGDINGDGSADVLMGDPRFSSDRGYVGASMGGYYGFTLELFGFTGNSAGEKEGSEAFTAGDLNGDGYADTVIPDQFGNFTVTLGGQYSGGPPSTITKSVPNPTHGPFTARAAGDVNGDGFGDLLVAAANTNDVRLYYGQAELISPDPIATLYGGQYDALAGWSVAMGDVNGDGFDDVVVGMVHWDGSGTDNGAIALYLGSQTGLPSSPSWVGVGPDAGSGLGVTVSAGGDVNGDGLGDIVAGAPGVLSQSGTVYVWYGRTDWSGATPDWNVIGPQSGAYFGNSVAFAGDVNGDGFADFLVGAPYHTAGGITHAGRVRLFFGSPSGPYASGWLPTATQAEALEGAIVAGAGDVNRDGYSDLLISSAYFDDGVKTDAGHARLYLGGPSGPSNTAAREWRGEAANDYFGYSACGLGDYDGDGAGDVAVGAHNHNGVGKVYVYRGNVSGADASPTWTFDAPAPGNFGSAVASAGDVNNDGRSDLLVGSVYYDSDSGAGFVYTGGSASNAAPYATLPGPQFYRENAGHAVAGGGDVNGDGFGDVAVGAPRANSGYYDEGAVRVYAGGADRPSYMTIPGRPHPTRQLRPDNPSVPIGPYGMAPRATSFGLDVLANSPAGRTRVAMEWQVAGPSGPPLTGRTDWTLMSDLYYPLYGAVGLLAIVPELNANTVYSRKVRILSRSPYFRYGPWLSPQPNAQGQWDLRTSAPNTGVPLAQTPATTLELSQAWPNPSRGAVQFAVGLPHATRVKLVVRDVQGRAVRALEDREMEAGRRVLRWDGADDGGSPCAAGIYFLELAAGDQRASRRVAVVR